MPLCSRRVAVVGCAAFLLSACSRDLELPVVPGAGGETPDCPEVAGLAANPTPIRAGMTLQIGFTIADPPAAPPVVTVVGREASLASGPGPGGAYSFSYTVVGDEVAAGAATGAEGPVVVTFTAGGRSCSAQSSVTLDFVPPALEQATSVPAAGVLEPGELFELQLVATEPLAVAPSASATGGFVLSCGETAQDHRRYSCSRTLDGSESFGPLGTITVELGDAAGNEASVPADFELSIDLYGGTAPVLSGPSVSASRARTGDDLTIDFAVDRSLLGGSLVVTVDGRPATPAGAQAEPRSFVYSVGGSETEGEVEVAVTATDVFDRSSTARTTVLLDFTPPFLVSLTADLPTVGVGQPVTLTAAFSEAVLLPTATVGARPAPCVAADGTGLSFSCSFSADGTEPDGPQDVALSMLDLVGNPGSGSRAGVFALDLSCVAVRAQTRVERRSGSPATFRAAPASFEPGATLDFFTEQALQTQAGTVTADALGGVAGFVVADSSELWVRATSPRGPACAPFRAPRTFTATFAAKVPGSLVENPGELHAGTLPRLFPALAALDALPEADAAGYGATVGDGGGQLAVAAASPAEDRVYTHLTPPGATCPFGVANYGAALDPLTGDLLVLGGLFSGGGSWRFDGATWTPGPADPRGERGYISLACDPTRGFCVSYGGQSGGNTSQDTIVWDAAGLRRVANAGGPGTAYLALTWDPSRGLVVGWSTSGDLWSFDGTSWTLLADEVDPLSVGWWNSSGSVAYDEAGARLVMRDDDASLLVCDPGHLPATMYSTLFTPGGFPQEEPLAYAPGLGRLVVATNADLLEWDGGALVWVPAGGDLPPAGGLLRSALVADPGRDVLLFVSVIDRNQFPSYGCDGLNVWEYAVRSETPVASARLVVPPELAASGATLSLRLVADGRGEAPAGPVSGTRLFLRDPATGRFTQAGAAVGGPGAPLADRTVALDLGALAQWQEADGSIRLVVATTGKATTAGVAGLGLDSLELVATE